MNYTTLILFLITWILAFVFLILWRTNLYKQELDKEWHDTIVKVAAQNIEELRAQLDIDEKLLNDPGLHIVTYCKDCKKRDVNGVMCKTFLSMNNQKKDSYCSEGTTKDA